MKASKLRGKPGQFGMLMATALLIRSLLDLAYGLMGKPSSGQAEQILFEAQQVQLLLSQGRSCRSALCVPYFHVRCNLKMCAVLYSKCCRSHHKAIVIAYACVCFCCIGVAFNLSLTTCLPDFPISQVPRPAHAVLNQPCLYCCAVQQVW